MTDSEIKIIAAEISLETAFSDTLCDFINEQTAVIRFFDTREALLKGLLFKSLPLYRILLKIRFSSSLLPMINLYHAVVLAEKCRAVYEKRGIAPEVYRDTMNDINTWTARYYLKTGNTGLMQMGWIRNHLNLRLFKLGRLQFEKGKLNNKNIEGFSRRTDCLHIHIPEGEKLSPEKCSESLNRARGFFKTYWDKDYPIGSCHSWLLYENLKMILDMDSNIVQFSRLFRIIENDNDNKQALERVFGEGLTISSDLPENTSLQRKMKAFLQKGNRIGMGFGIVEFEDRDCEG
jgi:GNAT-like C-terminal domain/N-acyltransferase N-terminal domain